MVLDGRTWQAIEEVKMWTELKRFTAKDQYGNAWTIVCEEYIQTIWPGQPPRPTSRRWRIPSGPNAGMVNRVGDGHFRMLGVGANPGLDLYCDPKDDPGPLVMVP